MGLRGHKTATVSFGQTVRFLVALIGPTHVAFPAHWVRGIITPAEAGGDGPVMWANSSYDRTDLAARFAITAPGQTAETRIILYGNEQKSRSFSTEQALGLVDVDRSQIHPLPTQFRGGERERLLGFFIDEAYVALIANPFWVLELPTRKNPLDAFVLQVSDRQVGVPESGLPVESFVREDAMQVSGGRMR